MLYDNFVEWSKKNNKSNIFISCSVCNTVPNELMDFYKKYNPLRVNIWLPDDSKLKFINYESLSKAQCDYKIGNGYFIFANVEGDPIVIKEGIIYSAIHGVGEWNFIRIFNSFDDFIDGIMNDIFPVHN
jgi:hypothetical protein